MPGEGRHFATVLFLDIVGSTQIADELGDAGWHRLLARFRSTVRAELKRHGGHEVDTAGDGFFATFADPLAAIRAADAITRSVQDLGLDVRAGVHAGEVESSDKHVTGMTVHLGAPTMAFAEPAQVVVTSTVRDMEIGGPVAFEDEGDHELKGVPGAWHLSFVAQIGDRASARALGPSESAARRAAMLEEHPRRRAALVTSSALVLLLAIAGSVFARRGMPQSATGQTRPVLVRVDLSSGKTVASIDRPTAEPVEYSPPGHLVGRLVRVLPDHAEYRDMITGAPLGAFPLPSRWDAVSIGGGGVWLGSRSGVSSLHWLRFDQWDGSQTADVDAPEGAFDTLRWGPGGGWFITGIGSLANIDPVTLAQRTHPTPASFPVAVPYASGVWIADPTNKELYWFDAGTGSVKEVAFPSQHLLIVEGADYYAPQRLYLLDAARSEIEPLGNGTIPVSRAFYFSGDLPSELLHPQPSMLYAARMGGRSWVVAFSQPPTGQQADSVLVGLPLVGSDLDPPAVIPMPQGFQGHWPLADRRNGSIWVGSCYCDEPF